MKNNEPWASKPSPYHPIAGSSGMEDTKGFDVAIVGAGFSGTMVAYHLTEKLWKGGCSSGTLALFEKEPRRLGLGIAYETTDPHHLLNVRAANMSALPDDPKHLVRWLKETTYPHEAEETMGRRFIPRTLYGQYLHSIILAQKERLAERLPWQIITQDIQTIEKNTEGEGYCLVDGEGNLYKARQVVLATGALSNFEQPLFEKAQWIESNDHVVVVGAGLTMVDLAMSLWHRPDFKGTLTAISRHGLLPWPHPVAPTHAIDPTQWALQDLTDGGTIRLRTLMRRMHHYQRETGADWRLLVDGLRPYTQRLWVGFSPKEQRQFQRHVRAYWDVVRHRMAPEISEALKAFQQSGRFKVLSARVVGHHGGTLLTLQPRGGTERETMTLKGDHVLFYTGLEDGGWPLLRNLLQEDVKGNLPRVSEQLEVFGPLGEPMEGLFALGPALRDQWWETIAIPELRNQAQTVAEGVYRTMAQRPDPMTPPIEVSLNR